MRRLAIAFTTAALLPAAAQAEPAKTLCAGLIGQVAEGIPDLAEPANAATKPQISDERLQAARAALDGARALKGSDQSGCLTMVNTARLMLARDKSAPADQTYPITDLQAWRNEPLYENSWRAEALIDRTAYNKRGEEIGEVHDILMTPNGKITAIIVEGGGFLDIGDSHVRVGWNETTFDDDISRGVTVPLKKENMTDYSLFEADEKHGPRIGEDELRMSSVLNRKVRLRDGAAYGYIEDLLVTEGKVMATIVRPDITYGTGGRLKLRATPYFGREYGYSPGYDYYLLPYDASQLSKLDNFDIQRVKGPGPKSAPDKKQ